MAFGKRGFRTLYIHVYSFQVDEGKDGAQQDENEGPDVSEGNYGVQEMNQSKSKGSVTITAVKDLKPKMAGNVVYIRGRLHTSRAKGKLDFRSRMSVFKKKF